MTLRTALRRLFLIAGVLLLVGVVAVVALSASRADAEEQLDIAIAARTDIASVRLALVTEQSGMRGYVLSGLPEVLAQYQRGVDDREAALSRLQGVVDRWSGVFPEGGATIAQIREQIALWEQDGVWPAIRARQAGDLVLARDIAGSPDTIALSTELRRRTLLASESLTQIETDLGRRAAMANNWFTVVLVLTLLAIVVLSLAMWWVIRRMVSRPLEQMVADVRAVTGGDHGRELPAQGPAELRVLAGAVDDMRRQIVSLLDVERGARRAIEQEAIVTTQLSSSLAGQGGDLPSGWSAATYLHPVAGLVAGDSCTVELLSPNRLGVIVLDISGHGASNALSALKAKEILRAGLRTGVRPDHALEMVWQAWDDDDFLSAFVAVVHTDSGVMWWANAGHPPALVTVNATGDSAPTLLELCPTGPVLAVDSHGWQGRSTTLDMDTVLVAVTDGLLEARADDGEQFGHDRLRSTVLAAVNRAGEPDAHNVIAACLQKLSDFGGTIRDDITVISVWRGSPKGGLPGGVTSRVETLIDAASGDTPGQPADGSTQRPSSFHPGDASRSGLVPAVGDPSP